MLCFDIETETFGKPDPAKDRFKFLSAYEYETNTYFFIGVNDEDYKEKILTLFKRHRVVISFNGNYYDIPIMKREGLWNNNHLSIDLMEVMKKRGHLMGAGNISYSLKNVAKFFKLEEQKQDAFNYDILKKEEWTDEELKYIEKYAEQDIKTTKALFEKVNEFFKCFSKFLNKHDNYNYKWLTTTSGVYSYKVICNMAGIKEEYADNVEHMKYEGGFVSYPIKEEYHDDIYLLDFNSLYPHNNIQGNLYSWNCKCCKDDEKWHGNALFPVNGKYCKKKKGSIESTLETLYALRSKYKAKGMKEEYALKIVLNTIYGISGNPVFKNVYNHNSASDCTLIGRNAIKFARKKFRSAGYEVIYTDTDSVFVQDKYKDESRLMMVKDSIIRNIKKNLIFPCESFDMGVDDKIKHLWFFKSGDVFKKKHYMYVNEDDELIVKGLPMIKRDSSKLGYYIFNKYMKDEVIKGNIKFDFNDIKVKVFEEIKNDIKIAARQFKVWEAERYKLDSQIQKVISVRYGVGTHLLIPNKYVGVGKSIKYCTLEEFEKKGLTPHAIILNKMWNELKDFLNYIPERQNAHKIDVKEDLLRWTNC